MRSFISIIILLIITSCSPCKIEHYHLKNENHRLKAALKYHVDQRKMHADSIKEYKRRIEKQN